MTTLMDLAIEARRHHDNVDEQLAAAREEGQFTALRIEAIFRAQQSCLDEILSAIARSSQLLERQTASGADYGQR